MGSLHQGLGTASTGLPDTACSASAPGVGTLLASGSKDNSVRLWSEAGACLALGGSHAGAVSAVAFSRRGVAFLVSGGADKLLKVHATLRFMRLA